jgi:ribosomal-protein-alanine N-acetyltransferase
MSRLSIACLLKTVEKGELMVTLETNRLILRDYKKEDLEEYYRLKSDKETMYYLQDILLDSMEEAREDLDNVLLDQLSKNRSFYFLHLTLKETNEVVGSIGYTVMNLTPVGKLVHLGYFTYPKFWGNGYVTEAARRLIQYAFEEDDVYRITTGCLQENVGSEKVMMKCNMIKEAEHLEYEWHDNDMKTRLEYRLLKSEWDRINSKE